MIPLLDEEERAQEVIEKKALYTQSLKEALGKRYVLAKDGLSDQEQDDDTPVAMKYEPMEGDKVEPEIGETDQVQHEAFDRYITARVNLPQGESKAYGTVMGRKRDANGDLVGISHQNSLLDIAIYEVQFDSGDVEEYNANIIAKSIYAQVDDDGYTTYLLHKIIDHHKSGEALKDDDEAILQQGTKLYRTTRGWELCVNWNDDSTSWVPLMELKDLNPIETDEYAKAIGIAKDLAFRWWVPYTLKKRDRLIMAMKK